MTSSPDPRGTGSPCSERVENDEKRTFPLVRARQEVLCFSLHSFTHVMQLGVSQLIRGEGFCFFSFTFRLHPGSGKTFTPNGMILSPIIVRVKGEDENRKSVVCALCACASATAPSPSPFRRRRGAVRRGVATGENYWTNLPCFSPIVPRLFGASASLVSNLSIICKNIFSFSGLFS